MFKRGLLTTLLLVVFSISGVSFASKAKSVKTVKENVSGFYVGYQGGYGGMYTPKNLTSETSKVKNYQGFAWRLYGGHLWERDKIKYGLEMGVVDYPDNNYQLYNDTNAYYYSYKYKGFYLDFLGVLKYDLPLQGISVFGKGGLAYVDQETKLYDSYMYSDYSMNEKHMSKWFPKLALGISYNFSNRLGIDLTCSYVFGNKPKNLDSEGITINNINKVAPVGALMLGLFYKV